MTSREQFEAWFFGSKYAQVVIPTSYVQQIWLDACEVAYAAGQEAMRERAKAACKAMEDAKVRSWGEHNEVSSCAYQCAKSVSALEIEK